MADWKDIKTTKYDGAYNYESVTIKLQYDADASTPTKLVLRFYATSTSSNGMKYYILWKPSKGGSGEQMRLIKAANAKASTNSTTITITKTYNASSFTIPEYWLVHTGSMSPWQNADDNNRWYISYYNDSLGKSQSLSVWKFFENETSWWNNSRRNFKTVVSSFTVSATASNGLKATAVSAGSVSITDNGNNTFTLKGAKGASGDNNPSSGPTLSWGYSTSYGNSFTNNSTKDLTIATKTNATRTVYAKCVTGATYGDDKTVTTSANIKQYVAPSAASKISFAPDTKTRLTNKEKWILSWTKGTKTNDSSPVEGYRIRIYVNDKTIAFKNGNKEVVTTDSGSGAGRYYYDRDQTSTSMNFYANLNGLKPGDKVFAHIHCYTKNAKGTKIFSDSAKSSTYTVQHAGVMRIKSDGKWYEGEVYIKADGKWIEADVVHVKSDGKWYESE